MSLMSRADDAASKHNGTLTAILVLIQLVLLPGLGWMFIKVDAIQTDSSQTQTDIAVFGDRQQRQGVDITDIKNTLKGVETKSDARAKHKKIWQTDQDQYERIDQLDQGQRSLESRVQRLETESSQWGSNGQR